MFGGLEQAPLVRQHKQVLALVQGEFRRGGRGDEEWWFQGGSWLGTAQLLERVEEWCWLSRGVLGEQQLGGRKF